SERVSVSSSAAPALCKCNVDRMENSDLCGICGGDGRIGNSFGGSMTTCPGCHGTGRKADTSSIFRDVTKTKASHHAPGETPGTKAERVPTSFEGVQLAKAIGASTAL